MTGRRISHRIEHLLLRSFSSLVLRIPESAAARLGTGLGWIAGSVLRIRRKVVDENLARAFPDRSRRWRSRVATATYGHFGREAVSFLLFQAMSSAELRGRCDVEGFELLQESIERGKGVILLLAHFGNWEIGGASIASRGVPLVGVARKQSNPLFDDYIVQARARLGLGVIYRDEGARAVMRALRVPKVVALVADQNVPRDGVFVDFFQFPASTARGPGVLAIRTGAPVVFMDPRRIQGSRARYRIRFSLITFERADELEENVRRLTRAYMSRIEQTVRENPGQYFWFHRRWKTRPAVQEPDPPPQVAHAVREEPTPAPSPQEGTH